MKTTDILVVGARGIPNMEGGAEKNAEKLFPLFADAGYAVELTGLSRHIRRSTFKGVKLTGFPTLDILKTDKIVYNLLAVIYAAFKRPRIVHLQCLNSALFLVCYKLLGLKVVMRYGSSDYEFAKWGFIERQALRLCEYQVRFADHVITVSEKFRKSLIERHGLKRVSVIPNGLDPVEVSDEARRFHDELGLKGKRYVLSVGRVTADKSFETLVDAVKALDDSDVQLIVAGGAEAGYAEKFFDDDDERIRFVGRVDRDLLSALYANCAVYVNSSRHEGLSNAILEALSYRCPLIVSDIVANQEMGLSAHNYFAVGSVVELRQQIAKALAEPDAYTCPIDHFASWTDVFEQTASVYAEVAPRTFSVRPTGPDVSNAATEKPAVQQG